MINRKNLLISPVGKNAFEICKGWISTDRSYDIMFIYYDMDGYENFKNTADYFVLTKGFKFPLIHQILSENLELITKYNYFFFPDDDIRITSRDIDRLFSFATSKKISVCQPSLYPKNFTWPITKNNPDTLFRYVSMVEIMCPVFSKDALNKCLPSFTESYSGWGLEVAWYRLLGSKQKQFIIYDLVIAIHEGVRGSGSKMYDNLSKMGIHPADEYHRLEKKYDWKIDFYDIHYVYRIEFIWNSFWKKVKSLVPGIN